MTTILKQRLIGATILLFVIALIATFLSSHANKENDTPEVVIKTNSVFSDSGSLNTDVELLQYEDEAEVEPVYEDTMQSLTLEPQQEVVMAESEAGKKTDIQVQTHIQDQEPKENPSSPVTNVQGKADILMEDTPKTQAAKQSPVVVKPDSQQKGWIIQLASFTQQKYADALLDKAKKKGYKANIETVQNSGKKIYRVRIGPEYNRSKVDELVVELSNDLKVSPQVLQYTP